MNSYNVPAPVRLSWELAKDASHFSMLHEDLAQTSVTVSAELFHNSFHKHVPQMDNWSGWPYSSFPFHHACHIRNAQITFANRMD